MSTENSQLSINAFNRTDAFLDQAEKVLIKDPRTATLVDRVSSVAGIIIGAVVVKQMEPFTLTVSYNGASHTFSNEGVGGSVVVLSCLGGAANAMRNLGVGLSSTA